VPFIAVRPGVIPAGHVVEEPVALIGLTASLLAFAAAESDAATEIRNAAAVAAEEALADQIVVSESYLRITDRIAISSGGWRYIENRDVTDPDHDQHGQMNAEELQRIGAPQNGVATDHIDEHPEIAAALRERLRVWEAEHPKAPASTCGAQPNDEIIEQLRAIGYIDGEHNPQETP